MCVYLAILVSSSFARKDIVMEALGGSEGRSVDRGARERGDLGARNMETIWRV